MTIPYGLLVDPTMVRPQVRAPLGDALPQPQQVAPAALPQPRASLMDRIRAGFSQLPSALFPTPEGMNGLLSDEDIGAARKHGLLSLGLGLLEQGGPQVGPRVSLGQAFARSLAGAQQAQQQQLGSAVQVQGALAQRAGLLKQQQLEQARQAIAAKYPIPQGASREQIANALRGMLADFVRIGDTEMVAKLNSVAPALFDQAKGQQPEWVDFGGYKALLAPDGTELKRVAKTPNPRDPNAPDTAQQLRDQRMFTRAQQLGDDYRQQTKQFATVADNIAGLQAVAPAAKSGNPAAQMSVIFQYMKLLDPGSTVREGEYANAENTRGVPDHIRNLYNKVREGAFLTPEQVDNFVGQAGTLGGVWQKRLGTVIRQYQDRAKRWGVDPNDVVYDYFGNVSAPSAATAPNAQGNADNVLKWLTPNELKALGIKR